MPKVAKAAKAAKAPASKKLAEPVKAAPPPKEVRKEEERGRSERDPHARRTPGLFAARRLAQEAPFLARPPHPLPLMHSPGVELRCSAGRVGPEVARRPPARLEKRPQRVQALPGGS